MSLITRFFKKLRFYEPNNFAWLGYLFICSLFFSRAGLAISGVLLLLYSTVYYIKCPFRVSLKPVHVLLFTIYAAYLLSTLFASQNFNYGLHLLFKNAVFIILPLAFLFSEKLSDKTLHRFLLLYLLLALFCVSLDTWVALSNYSQFLEDVGNSKNVIPIIGPSHAELGLLSTVAFVFGVFLVKKSNNLKHRLWLICLLGLLFVELHIIAYRFSIMAIYLLIALYTFSELIRKRNLRLFLLAGFAFSIAVYALSLVPSVKIRLQNTVNDLSTVSQGRNPNYQSITQRILAVDCAFEIAKQHPWLGVSPLNAHQKMEAQYAKNSYLLIPENRMFIHNQFMYYVLSFGIPFGLLIAISLVVLVCRNYRVNPILFWAMLPFLFHMMIENTLEKQITANAFIFIFLILSTKKDSF